MSQENVEATHRAYEHFIETGDVLIELFDPDYVLDMSSYRGWPERQTYRGIEGMRTFLADWLEPWDDYEFEVEEQHDVGDKVVSIVRQRGRSKVSGVPVEMHLAHVTTFRAGRIIRLEMYATPDEGLDGFRSRRCRGRTWKPSSGRWRRTTAETTKRFFKSSTPTSSGTRSSG